MVFETGLSYGNINRIIHDELKLRVMRQMGITSIDRKMQATANGDLSRKSC